MESHRRHDLSDAQWALIEPHLPGQVGQWGRVAKDNRTFVNAVLFVLRTGTPWRDLPPDFGKWYSVHYRFSCWVKSGVWEKLLEKLAETPDFEWIAVDGSHIKAHSSAAGAKGGSQDIARTKGGLTQKFILLWTNAACPSESNSQPET